MLGALAKYAASRAVQGATDSVVRRAIWMGLAGVLGLIGVVWAVLAVFWLLEPSFGPAGAAGTIAVVSLVIAGLFAYMPTVIERANAPDVEATDTVGETVAAIKEEAREAVDYVGPIRLVGSAFMLGLGVGRRVSR